MESRLSGDDEIDDDPPSFAPAASETAAERGALLGDRGGCPVAAATTGFTSLVPYIYSSKPYFKNTSKPITN